MDDALDPSWWEELDRLITLVANADEPYGAANTVCGYASAEPQSLVACRVFGVWIDLTDRYELWQDARRETEALMLRAASEWLAIEPGSASRESYFEQWEAERARAHARRSRGPDPRHAPAFVDLGKGFTVDLLDARLLRYSDEGKTMTIAADRSHWASPGGMISLSQASTRRWDAPHDTEDLDPIERTRILGNVLLALASLEYNVHVV